MLTNTYTPTGYTIAPTLTTQNLFDTTFSLVIALHKLKHMIKLYKHIPVAPKGWPRAMAPPFTLTFSGLSPSFLRQYTN